MGTPFSCDESRRGAWRAHGVFCFSLKQRGVTLPGDRGPPPSSPLASATVDVNLAYVRDVVFLDSFHGWVTVGAEFGPTQLLSTSDAGARWTIITPPPIKGDFVEHPPHIKTGPLIWKRPTS